MCVKSRASNWSSHYGKIKLIFYLNIAGPAGKSPDYCTTSAISKTLFILTVAPVSVFSQSLEVLGKTFVIKE